MRKIIILVLLAISVGASILTNTLASGVDIGFGLVGGSVEGLIGTFIGCASCYLIWIGWPIGWNFAANNGLGLSWQLVLGFLCVFISLPAAIYQLFKPNY